MILVYGDDSADELRERVCAVAVVIGTEDSWRRVEEQWKARNGAIPFHARDCESDQGDYRTFDHRQNKDLYKDLATLIAGSGLAGRTIAINLDAQRTIFPNSPEIAYYKAFAELLEDVKGVCAHFGSKAEFTFDIGTENEYNAGQLYAGARDDSREMFNLFAEKLSFARAREHARLQVADLIAYEGMKEMDNKIGPVKRPMRKSWAALSGTRRFQAIGYSWEWFKDLRRKLPELEKRSGINQQAYVQWLKERNRQHSISNMVHFTNWKAEQDRKRGV